MSKDEYVHAHVQQPELLAALRFVENGRSAGIPVLAGVMLEGGASGMLVWTFDYEVHASQLIDAPRSFGRTLVSARILREIVSVLPKGCEVRLTAVEKTLTVEAAGLRYKVPTLPRDEFPAAPAGSYRDAFTCTGSDLGELAQVLVATGHDGSLPVLTGVHVSRDPKTRRLVAGATDRYRLAVQRTAIGAASTFPSLLLPRGLVRRIAQAFSKEPHVAATLLGSVKGHEDQLVSFRAGARVLVHRLLDGEFPKYQSLLPEASALTARMTVEAGTMLTAIQQAAVGVGRQSPVRLHLVAGGKSSFQTGDDGRVDDVFAEVPVPDLEYDGDLLTIAYNPGYLRDGFRVFKAADRVEMAMTSPTKPAVFTSDARPGFTYLLMPVRLAN